MPKTKTQRPDAADFPADFPADCDDAPMSFVNLGYPCPTLPFSGHGVFRRDPLQWLVGQWHFNISGVITGGTEI